jgi:hypothetical protein
MSPVGSWQGMGNTTHGVFAGIEDPTRPYTDASGLGIPQRAQSGSALSPLDRSAAVCQTQKREHGQETLLCDIVGCLVRQETLRCIVGCLVAPGPCSNTRGPGRAVQYRQAPGE